MFVQHENNVDIHEQSTLGLAFVGDGVLELLVRARIASTKRLPLQSMHKQAVKIVSARAQADMLHYIEPHLTEREQALVRRGKNAHKASVAKNATAQEYSASNGLEALLGWLYLQGDTARVEELFELIWQKHLTEEQQKT